MFSPVSYAKPNRAPMLRRRWCWAWLCLRTVASLDAAQTVSLAWDPSPDTNVVGYFVYTGLQSGNYTSRTDAGLNMTNVVSGLVEAQTNYYAVTAYDAYGTESDYSNEVAYNVPGPVAPALSLAREPSAGAKISIAALLARCSGASGDPLFLAGLDPTTANGGLLKTNAGWIIYSPPSGFAAPDSFKYTIDDGAASASGTVTINVQSNETQLPDLVTLALPDGSLLVSGDGIPRRTYLIQFADTTSPSDWQTLATATADSVGYFAAPDPAPLVQRVYRSIYP